MEAGTRRERVAEAFVVSVTTLVSTWYVATRVILPAVEIRIPFIQRVFDGTADPPYQYRILKHVLARPLEWLLDQAFLDAHWSHAAAYIALTLVAFAVAYHLFYAFLRYYFPAHGALLGVLLLQAVIPLSITGAMMEGDIIALGFYLAGLHVFVRGRDAWLPLLVAVATLNREQMIYLVAFYGAFQLAHGILWTRRTILVTFASAAAWAAVFFGFRWYFDFRPNPWTTDVVLAANTDPRTLAHDIVPLWLVEVVPFVILALWAWPRTNTFYRAALVLLVPYTVLFFLNGYLYELAKYLPAHLVLIPVGLQALLGLRIPANMRRGDATPKATRGLPRA